MTGFRVVDSTSRCQSGIVELVDLGVVGPDGTRYERSVVRHPGAVVAVPVIDDDVILVRQFRAATGRALLEVPAGKRDVEGEVPEATAARELEEEIGFTPGRLDKMAEFYNSPGFCDEYTYLYCATALTPVERHGVTAEEAAMSIERVPLAATSELIAGGELVDAKSIIGLLLARELLGSGRVEGA
ncbi:MAG TPA: NUDIX hydrolase [Acidimicrobiia bacterium]|nr:NUDIX hydrolase [Acidimicrobiia bacterium]